MIPRYLFVNENIGGHSTVHIGLARAFAERDDVEVDFLDVPPATGMRRAVGRGVPGLRRLDADLQPLRFQLAGAAWVRRQLRGRAESYDALHIYTQNAALLAGQAMRAVPTVVTSDSTNALNAYRIAGRRPTRLTPHSVRLTRLWEAPVYERARLVVANSHYAERSLLEDYGVPAGKVRVVPFGIFLPPRIHRPNPRNRRPRLAFAGTSLERKGGNQLLRLHQRYWADRVDLLLITRETVPPQRGVVVVNDLNPGDARLWHLLADSDVFVFPSGIDQAPNAILEGMAASLPVVACPVGAIPEMVHQGVTGLLVPVADDVALRAAVESLLDDPAGAERMGAAGRDRVERSYDMRVSAEAILQVLAAASGRVTT